MKQSTPGKQPVDNPDIVEVGLGAILLDAEDVRNLIGDSARLLITRRAVGSIMAGYWELPGGKIEPGEIASIIASGDRKRAGPTLPPQGLRLEWVRYANTEFKEPRA